MAEEKHETADTEIVSVSQPFYNMLPKRPPLGKRGKEVKLVVNSFPMGLLLHKISVYDVTFEPDIPADAKMKRKQIVKGFNRDLRETYGVWFYDNTRIWAVREVGGTATFSNGSTTVNVRFLKAMDLPHVSLEEQEMIVHIILSKSIRQTNLIRVGRNYFEKDLADSDETHSDSFDVVQHGFPSIRLWRGYAIAVEPTVRGLQLKADVCHRVLQSQTVRQVIDNIQVSVKDDFRGQDKKLKIAEIKKRVSEQLHGSAVLTKYNMRVWRIHDIDWSLSILDSFVADNGEEMTYKEYFYKRYGKATKSTRKGMLIHIPRNKPDARIVLAPELCQLTGLTKKMKGNYQLMKKMADKTRLEAAVRHNLGKQLVERLETTIQHENKSACDAEAAGAAGGGGKSSKKGGQTPSDTSGGDGDAADGDGHGDVGGSNAVEIVTTKKKKRKRRKARGRYRNNDQSGGGGGGGGGGDDEKSGGKSKRKGKSFNYAGIDPIKLEMPLTIDAEEVRLSGRVLEQFSVDMNVGNNHIVKVGALKELQRKWGKCGFVNTKKEPILRWCIVYDENRDVQSANIFAQQIRMLAKEQGLLNRVLNDPSFKPLRARRGVGQHALWSQHLLSVIEDPQLRPQLIVCILPAGNQSSSVYSAIKSVCCCDRPILSQCIQSRNLNNQKRVGAICRNLLKQMMTKAGNIPWRIDWRIPDKTIVVADTMIIGVDVNHDWKQKCSTVGFCASYSKDFTQYHSFVDYQPWGREIVVKAEQLTYQALSAYHKKNGSYPKRIIVYRDGVSNSQLETVVRQEVFKVQSAFKRVNHRYTPELSVVVVQKRVSARFLTTDAKSVPPGTVVDNTVVSSRFWDFYLVTCEAPIEGTATPTRYIVVWDDIGLSQDDIQAFTNQMCALYFNWPGPIRVPAPCMYAHKIAYLYGTAMTDKIPNEGLNGKPYFL